MSEFTNGLNPLVDALARVPVRLAGLIEGRDDADLRRRPAAGEWSAKEIACHLRDASAVYDERLHRMMAEDHPFLAAYDEAAYARERAYQDADPAAILPDLRRRRERTVELLSGLRPDDWYRTGDHEEHGSMALVEIAAVMVVHEFDHLRDLGRLLEP